MIIECPYCNANVDCEKKGEIVRTVHVEEIEVDFDSFTTLFECRICGKAILCEYDNFDVIMSNEPNQVNVKIIRVWPNPDIRFSEKIPDSVKKSLDEANKCFKAGAYLACAVMCRRVIEGICDHFKIRPNTLLKRLEDLRSNKIIDERLFEWSEALRKHGNLGAHTKINEISKEDALYLKDFANSICEYIFVLSAKFESFLEKKDKK